jgi:hypothetical protein
MSGLLVLRNTCHRMQFCVCTLLVLIIMRSPRTPQNQCNRCMLLTHMNYRV